MKGRKVAVLWPDEENFARFRETNEGIRLDTAEAYRAMVRQYVERQKALGIKVELIAFDAAALLAFARSRGRDRVTSEIRATFAAMLAMERDRGS